MGRGAESGLRWFCFFSRSLCMMRLGIAFSGHLQIRFGNLGKRLAARQRLAFGQSLAPRLGADSVIGSCPLECMESIAQYVYRV